MTARRIAMAFAVATSGATPLIAQDLEVAGPVTPPKVYLGFSVEYGRAVGEFATYVRDGIGVDGHLVVPFTHQAQVSLRISAHGLIYGSETRQYTLLPGIGADVTTNNTIAGATIGPQFTAGPRGVRAYAYGGLGFQYFATTSSVSGSGSASSFAHSTNFDDVTFAGEAGAGLLIRLGRSRVYADLGARYLANGRVTYVTREGVTVNGGTLVVYPVTSDANMVIYHFGVSIGLAPPHVDSPVED